MSVTHEHETKEWLQKRWNWKQGLVSYHTNKTCFIFIPVKLWRPFVARHGGYGELWPGRADMANCGQPRRLPCFQEMLRENREDLSSMGVAEIYVISGRRGSGV